MIKLICLSGNLFKLVGGIHNKLEGGGVIVSKKINKLGGGVLNKWIRLAKKRKKWKLLGTGEYRDSTNLMYVFERNMR